MKLHTHIYITGFIFEFISLPVIKGFSSATAILVIESQIKVLMGISYLVPGFLISVQTLLRRYHEANYGDLLMGGSAIVFLIVFAVSVFYFFFHSHTCKLFLFPFPFCLVPRNYSTSFKVLLHHYPGVSLSELLCQHSDSFLYRFGILHLAGR